MTTFQVYKVLAALPQSLSANAAYAVRVGAGFDLYITDNTGLISYKLNTPTEGAGSTGPNNAMAIAALGGI